MNSKWLPLATASILGQAPSLDHKPSLPFDNSYTRLPPKFYTHQLPDPVSSPGLIRVNHALADYLGFDPTWLESNTGIDFAAGNFIPAGAEPIATVYAGHQFGGWNPQLGDGRAILLGELIANDGIRFDIQLKGSGRTPYSRGGDGRSPVGPVLREYIVSEAMNVLGVPTTRALVAATTGDRGDARRPSARCGIGARCSESYPYRYGAVFCFTKGR